MPFTQRQLFVKTLVWALIGSAIFVAIFILVIATTNLFHGPGGADKFVNGILFSSILGNLSGAGLVGWRIVDNYQHTRLKHWTKRYLSFCSLSVLVAIGLLYTPVTGLLAAWGLVASFIVQLALSEKTFTKRKKTKQT